MSDKGVCRTAPATPGLVNLGTVQIMESVTEDLEHYANMDIFISYAGRMVYW